MDLGREEFDWDRMRREEDDYFAVRNNMPKRLGDLYGGALSRIDVERIEEVERLRSMPYDRYLQTDHWASTRARCLERDGHQCRRCAGRRDLNVHHLTYERRGQELAMDVITLCRSCHELAHAEPAR